MTNKKLLFELKKELVKIKRMVEKENKKAEKYGEYPKMWMQYHWGNAGNYEFITSDRKFYIFACDDVEFPDVDISKIIYVCKHFKSPPAIKGKRYFNKMYQKESLDTLKGFFDIREDYGYMRKVSEHFKVIYD
ncbi:MAG: hypothetical protein NC340_03130 [Ruminococcus flavefaciens]|nr:hypothetical protein [Ruminococcus flavefaciens]MCM1229523.1 hypothetical protein [Ruminococcus flavefaciens]